MSRLTEPESAVVTRASPRLNGSGYVPSLDGWRAFAVLSVISVHDTVHKAGLAQRSFTDKHIGA
jgi:peptidoglycan/LPS O-acetylase OafA/YrhL